jgi:hypothetical protein
MNNLMSVLMHLEQERNRFLSRLDSLGSAIAALTKVGGRHRRRISAAGRARIAAAQRARWAKTKGQKVVPISVKKQRSTSAAGIARIRAAQKARWAKWRKEQKKAG